jgi:transposase
VTQLPDLNHLSHAEKDALIRELWSQVQGRTARVAGLEGKLNEPSKTPDNSSLPPSKGQKPNHPEKSKRIGPRKGSLGRKGGGRPLACDPDETVTAKAPSCAHCQAALTDADQVLHGRYDKIDLPVVRPVVTRVERYAGHCPCCGGVTLAPVPVGMEEGSPFSINIVALQAFRHARVPRRNAGLAIYLRFTQAISYRRLTQLFMHLYALPISEGALDAMLQRAKPCFDNEVAAILARLRRSRIVCSDETTVRIGGQTHWNWVFQNDQVVIHIVRNSRAASVVTETMAGHRPTIWVSDLYGAQQGHADPRVKPVGMPVASLPGAPITRLPIRHRGGRHDFRPAHEEAAAAGRGFGAAAQEAGREHPAQLSATAGSRIEHDHGARAHQSAWQAAAKTLRQGAQSPVHLPRASRGSAR